MVSINLEKNQMINSNASGISIIRHRNKKQKNEIWKLRRRTLIAYRCSTLLLFPRWMLLLARSDSMSCARTTGMLMAAILEWNAKYAQQMLRKSQLFTFQGNWAFVIYSSPTWKLEGRLSWLKYFLLPRTYIDIEMTGSAVSKTPHVQLSVNIGSQYAPASKKKFC